MHPTKVTDNYKLFTFIQNNRERNRGHIENLKAAFVEMGNLTEVQPILVNETMQIIDGQHRFDAARELGLPIHYTVVPGLDITNARQMNILHKTWNTEDYALSYADGGDANYRRYLELREEFGYSHSITLVYIIGEEKKGVMVGFRQGELTVTPEQKEAARDRLKHLEATSVYMPMHHQKEFAFALLKAMNAPNYDKQRMLQKMSSAREIPRFASSLDYLRALEDMYNRSMPETQKARLF